MNYKKITLDTERKSFESIVAMQGDNKSRYIKATIVNKSIPLDLTGCAVKFSAIKPDMTDIFNDAVISDATAGKVEIELTNQTLAIPGIIKATLIILKEDMQLSVLPFFITVIENPYNPNAIESKSEYKALNSALTVVDVYAKELQDASVNLEEKYTTRLNNFDEQLELISTIKVLNDINGTNYKLGMPIDFEKLRTLQSIQLANFFNKLFNNEDVQICCNGDSLTYGQDNVSEDKREPDTTIMPDGSSHTAYRAGVTYPEALSNFLNEIFPSKVTVINRGKSGDTTKTSYPRWNGKHDSDLSVLMFGTNDRTTDEDGIKTYIDYYEQIIIREILWGKGVIVLLPPRTNFANDLVLKSFKRAIENLCEKYNIPCYDAEEFIKNYGKNIFNDGLHFTTLGYKIIASRIVACLLSLGINKKLSIYPSKKLLIRPTTDNMILSSNTTFNTYAEGVVEETPGENNSGSKTNPMKVTMNSNAYIIYSFYSETDDLIVIPSATNYDKFKIELDFGLEQTQNSMDYALNLPAKIGDENKTNIEYSGLTDVNRKTLLGEYDLIRIPTSGYHTIRIVNTSTSTALFFKGLEFISNDEKILLENKTSSVKYFYKTSGTFETRIALKDLPNFSDTFSSAQRNPALKITVNNYLDSIIEYAFLMNTNTATYEHKFKKINEILFNSSIQGMQIDNISWDKDTQEMVITWNNSVDRNVNFVIQLL